METASTYNSISAFIGESDGKNHAKSDVRF